MECFKIFIAVLVFVTLINSSWQRLVEFHLRLDTDCTAYSPRMRALEVAGSLLQDLDPAADLTDCCCMNKNITCYLKYTGSYITLSTFTRCINDADAAKQGTYISNIGVTEVNNETCISVGNIDENRTNRDKKIDCTAGIKNFTGTSGTNIDVNTDCTRRLSSLRPQGQGLFQSQDKGPIQPQGHDNSAHYSAGNGEYFNRTTGKTIGELGGQTASVESGSNAGTIDKQVSRKSAQTDDTGNNNAATIGGALGGTLPALAILGPLAYVMYRKLKKNAVDDMNSSTDLFAIPPSVDFGEAPNSVAPAGTS